MITAFGQPQPRWSFMVWAYFDETAIHTKDAATGKLIPTEMLVGGCLASAANWQRLSAEWKRALKKEKVKVFHSKDFYAFRREFAWHTKSGKRDLRRHNTFRDQLADIITSNVEDAWACRSQ